MNTCFNITGEWRTFLTVIIFPGRATGWWRNRMRTYFNVTVIAEWCTFFAAIIILNRSTGWWRLFIVLMFLTLCVETTGWYMRSVLKIYNNASPFNLLMLLSTVFFILFFNMAKVLAPVKKWIVLSAAIFALFATVNMLFFEGFRMYNSFSESVGDIILIVICCYFFFSLLKNEEYIQLLSYSYFWLATGILFYALGSALYYHFSFLLDRFDDKTHIYIGHYINYTLNLILYACMIIAFICQRKTIQ